MGKLEGKKPYNPFHLAAGHAAKSLPNRLTIAVFKCYCNHTDFMGGSVSISVPTVAAETGYSIKAVNNANTVLKALGRITRKSRGRPASEGGKQSSITTVFCTDEELRLAGANEENFYSRGGKGFVVKTQKDLDDAVRIANPIAVVKAQKKMSESAKSPESKRKTGVVKAQPIAQEPCSAEPLKSEPLNQPLQAVPAALRLLDTRSKTDQDQTQDTQGNISPAMERPLQSSAPRCLWATADGEGKRCQAVPVTDEMFCENHVRDYVFALSHDIDVSYYNKFMKTVGV